MKKKFLPLLLALAAVFALLTISASAADIVDSGTCGENLTWTLDSDGQLVISGTGDMENFSSKWDSPFHSNCFSIRTIVIQPGVTSIGNNAFYGCNMTSVTIPEGVTSIGNDAFNFCEELTSVTIPESVTSIGNSAFYYCKELTSVTIPEGVTSIKNSVFRYCSSLTSVTIPASVTSIESFAFEFCSSLTSVTIPGSVTSIGNSTFESCSSLTSVTIPRSVTKIGYYAFRYCRSLTSVTISEGVTSIGGYAFEYCSSLTSATIPGSVTSIGHYAFHECTSLTDVTILYGTTGIGNNAFSDCSSLTSVMIPESVTSIGNNAFSDCSSLTSMTIPESVTSIGDSVFSGCTGLTSVAISEGVKSIDVDAFSGCTSLTSVTIPASITRIAGSAFSGCSSLTAINVEDDNPIYQSKDGILFGKSGESLIKYPIGREGAYNIPEGTVAISGGAFRDCRKLTSVTIPGSVTSIGSGAFTYCSSLTSVTIPESVTIIGGSAFRECTCLSNVTILYGTTSIGYNAFSDCSSLASITIPMSVTSIEESAFSNCSALSDVYYAGTENLWAKITIESGNNCLTDAPNFHFSYNPTGVCGEHVKWALTNDGVMTISGKGEMKNYSSWYTPRPWAEYVDSIKAVVIESGVTTVGSYAFEDCVNLTSAVLPEGITSVGSEAFRNCCNLESISLPASVTSIGYEAFLSCSSLTSVFVPAKVSSIERGVFGNCDSLTRIDVDASNPNYRSVDGILMNRDETVLVQYPAGKSGAEYRIPENIASIQSGAFYGCDNLTSVTVPTGITEIGENVFRSCNNLKYVDIPDSVVSIGVYAFYGSGLTRVTLGAALGRIGETAFNSDLSDIYYGGSEDDWNNIAIMSGNWWWYDASISKRGNVVIHYNFHRAEITEQPADAAVVVGDTARITVHAVGDGLTYKWQYSDDNGATWLPSSLKTATYSAKLTAEKDGRQVRCIVTDEAGNYVTSAPAIMRVSNLKITTQPKDYVGAVNSLAKITVTASGDGLTYQWQYSDDNGKTWLASSLKSATYSAKLTADKDGRQVRCVVTDKSGASVISSAAKMSVSGVTITTQPKDYVGAVNSTAKFTIAASGTGLTYQWQYSDDNGKTWLASSLKSTTYSAKLTADKNGRMVRCVVKDQYGNSAVSNAAKMALNGPAITTQPKDYTGAVNSTAKFTVAASGSGLTYQWQYSDDGGKTWLASSIKTATYSAKFTADKNNRMVRCIVTDASGNSVTSNAAKMTLTGPVITAQPQNYVGAVNSTAKFTVAATGDGLTYQWQYSDDNGATWLASSIKSATYSAKFTADKNGRMVRCIVTDENGNTVTSNAASMKLG